MHNGPFNYQIIFHHEIISKIHIEKQLDNLSITL